MPTQKKEPLRLDHWPKVISNIEEQWREYERTDRADRRRVLSARNFDESQTSGARLYIGASAQLQIARDNLQSLLGLLEHHGAGPIAPWNLLRPILEASFHALWMLESSDGLERRRRGLRLEVINYKERLKWLEEYKKDPGISKHISKEIARVKAHAEPNYRREASDLGLNWDFARQNIDVAGELAKLRVVKGLERGAPAHFVATWRSLSGFQHGYGYALVANSNLTNSVPIPGGESTYATIRDDAFEGQGVSCMYLFWEALRLYIARSWNQ